MPNHTYCFRTHRFRATVLLGMASLGMLLALSGCGGSDDPEPSTQFILSGQVNRSGTFTRTDLQALPATTQSQGPVPGVLTGVSLWTLLTDAKGGGDLTTDLQVRNDFLRKYVVAMGSDGTKAVVALGEIDPQFGNQPDLSAVAFNGGSLDQNGLTRLVVPGDIFGGRYVSNLVSLEVLDADTSP
jgi:hypothetical protein